LFNIVQCGGRFGKPVMSAIGRVHYGAIRIIGTAGDDPADAMTTLPPTAEVRPHDKINIVGAAGPMGTMHVIRALCLGLPGITVFAGDVSDERLAVLRKVAEPLAKKNNVTLRTYNPKTASLTEKFGYTVLMAPIPALVAAAIPAAAPGGIINIFAGIAAHVTAEIDLDAYIGKRLYFIGTSGSTLDDMKLVLKKVVARKLDTDLSVAAVSGLDGAIDGIRAVEKNTMPGKILVYPQCRGLKLTPLTDLAGKLPLDNGQWNKKSEEALLEQFKK
jgi:threonine dehydrogenase-like Zn-dependent dehydrogenase